MDTTPDIHPDDIAAYCAACRHVAYPHHDCARMVSCPCPDQEWLYTTAEEYPVEDEDFCVYVGGGDDCYCHRCLRIEADCDRRKTEAYWRTRIAGEQSLLARPE